MNMKRATALHALFLIIILSAKNKNQVKNALIKADEAKLEYSFFASTMWRETPEEQVAETKSTSFDDLEVIACAIYGESEEILVILQNLSTKKLLTMLLITPHMLTLVMQQQELAYGLRTARNITTTINNYRCLS
ncbi:DUF2000 family protein [Enterobacter cloacae]|uniref:DUF2000 family protein n=1 Tax=Enterobacter cloacae TaxID=550 RepID=UPI00101AEF2D|nr:DUF2000 family protein [Enterobacter cloacae]QBC02006.1 DUF2000 family protein [Enterobacter cloacae]